jgi:hypothetical protein
VKKNELLATKLNAQHNFGLGPINLDFMEKISPDA